MKNKPIYLNARGMQELSLQELTTIDGGGFWETFGIITGIAVVIASVVLTIGFMAILI